MDADPRRFVAPAGRPGYVAAFVGLLTLAQLGALGRQFRAGYRPFLHAPTRVPFSWDMFSTAISRCGIEWDPPLRLPGKRFGRLRDAGLPLEWDPVYDRVEDYVAAAEAGCTRATDPTVVRLLCFTRDGTTVRHAFVCR